MVTRYRSSCSSGGRMSASPRCSTASRARGAPSSRRLPGTTRDVIEQPVDVERDARFSLLDTGGMFGASEDPLHELVVDRGTARDRAGGPRRLRGVRRRGGPGARRRRDRARCGALGMPMIAVVNKTDVRPRAKRRVAVLRARASSPLVEISAEHGQGVGDLLDEIVDAPARLAGARTARSREGDGEADAAPSPRRWAIAIVGRPNAGKSSLVNRLLREERMLVSEVPGTTRDAVDAVLRWHRRTFRIVDTAGIRRPGRVARSGQVESLSVIIARRAIEKRRRRRAACSTPPPAPPTRTRRSPARPRRPGCGVIVAANKWDLMKDRGPDFVEGVRRDDPPAAEVPRLRAGPAHLGDDRRADAEAARDDRQGGGVAAEARAAPES